MKALCKVCQVSTSGYYDWKKRPESQRDINNRAIPVKIRSIFKQSKNTYGAIRMTKQLKKEGSICNKKRVARIMKLENLVPVQKTKFKPSTTDSNHILPKAENVINQDFSTTGINQKWGADITYINTTQGWLYLAVVIDFFSRKVIGWALGSSLHADLACNALNMALLLRRPPKELIHHSDRGVQYAGYQYSTILDKHQITRSMSRTGNCYDNSLVESYFHTLKVELIYQMGILDISDTKNAIHDYIDNFYNSWRLHSSLDYLSPNEYEENYRLAA